MKKWYLAILALGVLIILFFRMILTQLQQETQFESVQQQVVTKNVARKAMWAIVMGNILSTALILLYLFLLYRDLFIQKKIKDEMKNMYTLQRTILDSARQFIVTTDQKGIITTFNKGAETLLGYQADELVNKVSILNLYDPEMMENLMKDIAWRTGKTIKLSFDMLVMPNRYSLLADTEWLLKSKNGKLIPCLQSITPFKEQEKVLGFLFIATDMTERKIWEKNLQKALGAADAANLAKSKFLANISHDLRTPLNSIIGFANILIRNKLGYLKEQELNYIKRILDNGKILLNLINEILDLSKIEVGVLKVLKVPVDLKKLIENVVGQLEGRVLDKEINMIVDIPEDLKPLETDPEKLTGILTNLIGNAIKYTEKGHIITKVEADPKTLQPLEIHVMDTGIGMDEKSLKRIFEPFFQVENELSRHYEGAGLGLAIARSFAQLLGYQIRVESELGKGSDFIIILHPSPSVESLLQEKSHASRLSSHQMHEDSILSPTFYNQTVLMIDNDRDFLMTLGQHFKDLGCHVLMANDGQTGIELAKRHHIDLITLGVMLGSMNGYEIISHLQEDEELKKVPFAFISIVANEIRDKFPGAIDYLTKHVTYSDLSNLLKKSLRYRRETMKG